MNRVAAGEMPAGFGPARIWFVRHPDNGLPLPAKQVWGLATGRQGRDFISHQARDALRRLGFTVIGPDEPAADIAESPLSLDQLPPVIEGAERQVTRNIRERDPAARRAAETFWRNQSDGRLVCLACRLDFGKAYGSRGEGFMHFHHLAPMAEAVGEREVRPDDLVPLCPNCHAIAHRGENLIAPNEIAALLAVKRD
ncbi:MAG: HNH endonuclease [Gemmobacter sp.]